MSDFNPYVKDVCFDPQHPNGNLEAQLNPIEDEGPKKSFSLFELETLIRKYCFEMFGPLREFFHDEVKQGKSAFKDTKQIFSRLIGIESKLDNHTQKLKLIDRCDKRIDEHYSATKEVHDHLRNHIDKVHMDF
jgi:hypothetical protein